MTDIRIPDDLWESDEEGVITTWFYHTGETISEGTVIAEIMVEKIQCELLSPATGTLSISIEPEVAVSKGDIVGTVTPA